MLARGFFGEAQEESRLTHITVMAVSPQQLHHDVFYALKGQLGQRIREIVRQSELIDLETTVHSGLTATL